MASIHLPAITFPKVLYSILSRRVARVLNFFLDLFVAISLLVIARPLPSVRWRLSKSSNALTGRTAIVTGSNSGIGLQIAKDLVSLGATVVLACRNLEKAKEAREEILDTNSKAGHRVLVKKLDTSSLASVGRFCEDWMSTDNQNRRSIDILVHNAGIVGPTTSSTSPYSEDGFELTYATNVLGSFLMTHLLEDCLSERARVIFTSSTGQYSGKISNQFSLGTVKNKIEPGFHSVGVTLSGAQDIGTNTTRYGQTKCMQVAFARLLQQRFDRNAAAEGVQNRKVAHAFSPGFTSTPIFGKFEFTNFRTDMLFDLLKITTVLATNVKEGAATGSWLASTDDDEVIGKGKGGRYFERCVARMSSVDLLEQERLDRLWIRWQADAGIEWLS